MAQPRHFLDIDRLDAPTLRSILSLAGAHKRREPPGGAHLLCHLGECVALPRLCFCLGFPNLPHRILIAEDRNGFHDRVVVVRAENHRGAAPLAGDLNPLMSTDRFIHQLG